MPLTGYRRPSHYRTDQATRTSDVESTFSDPHQDVADVSFNSSGGSSKILLSPSGILSVPEHEVVNRSTLSRRQLANTIRKRIESRLAGRIRNLSVRVTSTAIVLEGCCATYYSKQLAQHAALGVLEDEHLENAILVEVPK